MNKIKTFLKRIKSFVLGLYHMVFSKAVLQKALLIAVVCVFGATSVFAQTTPIGATELGGIGNTFASYVPAVQKIIYALAAICAMIGAFTIYFKMSNGDQDVKKTIMLTIGGCVGLVTLATTLPRFFGVNSVTQTVTFGAA